jgi:hypothetical protein
MQPMWQQRQAGQGGCQVRIIVGRKAWLRNHAFLKRYFFVLGINVEMMTKMGL